MRDPIPDIVHGLSQGLLLVLPVLGGILGRILAELFQRRFPRACMVAVGVGCGSIRAVVHGGRVVLRPAVLDLLVACLTAGEAGSPTAGLWILGQAGVVGAIWWRMDRAGGTP